MLSIAIGIAFLIALQMFCFFRPNWSVYDSGIIIGGSKKGKFYIYAANGNDKTEIPNDTLPKTWQTKMFRAFQGLYISSIVLLFLAMLVSFTSSAGFTGVLCFIAGLCILSSSIIWNLSMNRNYGDSYTPPHTDPITPKHFGSDWIFATVGGICATLLGLGLMIRKDTFVDAPAQGVEMSAVK